MFCILRAIMQHTCLFRWRVDTNQRSGSFKLKVNVCFLKLISHFVLLAIFPKGSSRVIVAFSFYERTFLWSQAGVTCKGCLFFKLHPNLRVWRECFYCHRSLLHQQRWQQQHQVQISTCIHNRGPPSLKSWPIWLSLYNFSSLFICSFSMKIPGHIPVRTNNNLLFSF